MTVAVSWPSPRSEGHDLRLVDGVKRQTGIDPHSQLGRLRSAPGQEPRSLVNPGRCPVVDRALPEANARQQHARA